MILAFEYFRYGGKKVKPLYGPQVARGAGA